MTCNRQVNILWGCISFERTYPNSNKLIKTGTINIDLVKVVPHVRNGWDESRKITIHLLKGECQKVYTIIPYQCLDFAQGKRKHLVIDDFRL